MALRGILIVLIALGTHAVAAATHAPAACTNTTSVDGGASFACVPAVPLATRRLLLWFGGSCSQPADYAPLLKHAATLGFHALSVRYDDCPTIAGACSEAGAPGSSAEATCFGALRHARLFGGNLTVGGLNTSVAPDEAALAQARQALGQLGWLKNFTLGPDFAWPRIVVAGSSQGAGMALMLSQIHPVAAALQFAGTDDVVTSADGNSVAAPWIGAGSRAPKTPLQRVYGFSNVRGFCCQMWHTVWDELGLIGTYASVDRALRSGSPIPRSHRLCSARPEGSALQEHSSAAKDPYFAPVWSYLLSQGASDLLAINHSAPINAAAANIDTCHCLPPKSPP